MSSRPFGSPFHGTSTYVRNVRWGIAQSSMPWDQLPLVRAQQFLKVLIFAQERMTGVILQWL